MQHNVSGNSHSWQKMIQVRDKAEPHIIWHINSRNSSIWWDNWTEKGPLASLFSNANKSSKILIKDFIQDGNWNIQRLKDLFPDELIHHIENINIGKHDLPGQAFWDLTDNGKYSYKTSLHLFRDAKEKDRFLTKNIISNCNCCNNPKKETMQHVFVESDAARYIWKAIGSPLGIIPMQLPIRGLINHWWLQKSKNALHKFALQIIPIIICWEMWKSRCSCKYGDEKRFNYYKMKQQIYWNTQAAINRAFPKCKLTLPWVNFCDNMMKLQPIPKAISVCWNKPKHGVIKVNTDGSFIHCNGKAGLEGVVRNDQGDLIMAFSIPSRCSNNNMSEAQAAMFDINWCVQNGFSDFTIKLDSMLVMNMLKEGDTNNYRLKKIIKDTSHIMNQANITPVHCFREANEVADSLAKLATTNSEAKVYLSFQQLPKGTKGSFVLDKHLMPTVRLKYDKGNFFVS
nr:uncharacterized protein LOC117277902 [Nicotiana tomentosiformis]